MNRLAMTYTKFALLAAALSAALAVAGCDSSTSQSEAIDPPLAGASIGGPFELVDPQGKAVNWSDFDGKYRIVYFGYAYCPDVCPLDVQYMARGVELFEQSHPELAGQVVPIFITIDPERDTPEVIGEFIGAFSDRLVGLTGTPEQIAAAAKAFGAYYRKGEEQPGGGYLMDHTRAAYLMGRKGEPIALLPV